MTDSNDKIIRLGLSELTNKSLYSIPLYSPTDYIGTPMEMTKEEQDQKMIISCYRTIFFN